MMQEVQVKNTMFGPTNIAQYLAVIFGLLTYTGHTVPPDLQKDVLAGTIGAVTVFTWVRKNFFTKSISTYVANKM